MARRRGKHGVHLGVVVLLLVSAVVGYCVLQSLEDKWGLKLGLPDIPVPGVESLYKYLDSFVQESKGQMDNAVAVSAGEATLWEPGLTVHMLDVGQAECILIRGPDQNVLIDAGENGQGAQILQYLKAQGVDRLHLLIGTHPHSDHIGGMDDVIRGIPVDTVILPDIPDALVPTTKTYTDLLGAIIEARLEVEPAKPGLKYELGGGAALTVLGPGEEFDDLNDLSVISKVTYGKTSFLFTGDASIPAEHGVLARGGLSADVLNVGHHGSNTATSQGFLDAVHPRVALISCGVDNSYGHPHRDVMERLQSMGMEIYRTDLQGTVVVASDGERLQVTTQQ